MTESGSTTDLSQLQAARTSPPDRAVLQALTSVRFFAAAWVVLFHYRVHMEVMLPGWQRLRPIVEQGWLGVDLFFVLSGFIITYNYADRLRRPTWRNYRTFLVLRLARMYPVHLFTLLTLAFLVLTARFAGQQLNGSFTLAEFIRQCLLLSAWTRAPADAEAELFSWNYPAWSISAEWAAYVAFPVFALATVRVRSLRAAWLSLGFWVAAGHVLGAQGLISAPIPRIAVEFGTGVLLARLYAVTRSGRAWDHVATFTVLSLIPALWFLRGGAREIVVVTIFTALVIALAHARGGIVRLLSVPWLVFFGEASYSLYMTHAIVEMVGNKALPMEDFADDPMGARLAVLLVHAVTIGLVAVAVYLLVEKPSRDSLRRRALPRAAAPRGFA